jgi:hypothetical protein
MREIAADPTARCHLLHSGTGIAKYQRVGPDLFLQKQARSRGPIRTGFVLGRPPR